MCIGICEISSRTVSSRALPSRATAAALALETTVEDGHHSVWTLEFVKEFKTEITVFFCIFTHRCIIGIIELFVILVVVTLTIAVMRFIFGMTNINLFFGAVFTALLYLDAIAQSLLLSWPS